MNAEELKSALVALKFLTEELDRMKVRRSIERRKKYEQRSNCKTKTY